MHPHLEEVELKYDTTIVESDDGISHVYFPNSGIISLLTSAETDSTHISFLVGREGMAGGLCLVLGAPITPIRAIVQGDGTAMRMKAADFQIECDKGGALPGMLMRFTYSVLVQVMQSTACYRFHSIEERLARWLLMTCDRMETSELQLTQTFLSNMVGVRREAVAAASGMLRKKELINYTRGNISIIDRSGLETAACGCYKVIRGGEQTFPIVH